MFLDRQTPLRRLVCLVPRLTAFAVVLAIGTELSVAQDVSRDRLSQPIYRVPNQPVAQPVAQAVNNQPIAAPNPVPQRFAQRPRRGVVQAAVTGDPSDPFAGVAPEQAGLSLIDTSVMPASATVPAAPFDLTQQPGEHPFMPCLRVMQGALNTLDQSIADYSATFTKVERLSGTLGDPQQMEIRVRHRPFSVYMKFVQPHPGQEVLYVENQNDGKLVALASGWKRRIGKMNLDPNGAMAMREQRHPITKAGIRNLTIELIGMAESDVKYAECEVTQNQNVKIDGRPVTMVEVLHPVPRKNFKFHKARIFLDHELRAPVAFEMYSWPATTGGAPVLEERYIYTNVRVNNGFTDEDFSADNPALFN